MWPVFSRKTRVSQPARRLPSSFRPRLEALEDRCLLSALPSTPPYAGAPDPTFAKGAGYVTTSTTATADPYGSAVLIQPDGKIVVAGYAPTSHGQVMSLARYNTDGSLDNTFGSGGKVVSKIGTTWWNTAALYPNAGTANDGKIVEAGAGSLARFNTNGSTDTSFGSRGLVAVPWSIAGVVIQPDGKIVVGGDNGSAFELSRYNANGTLDKTFGAGGTATEPVAAGVSSNALALQADGKLVVAGMIGPGGYGTGWELARFTSTGALDNSTNDSLNPFGGGTGYVTTTFAAGSGPLRGLAIYPSTGTDTADYGKIVAAGSIDNNPGGINSNQVALARYNANGTADPTFGQSGQVVTPFPSGGGMAWATAIQADGKVVVAGQTYHYPGNGHWAFSVLRYNTDGSPDTTFGNGGLVVTPNATGDSKAYSVAIQADGRIVAAGSTNTSTGWDYMVARYLPSEPEVGSFTASPNPVTSGSSVTLTASNITDGNPNSTITQVAFYVDSNGDGKLDAGDALLGYGSQSNGVWTYTFTVGLAPASCTLFGQAEDSYASSATRWRSR